MVTIIQSQINHSNHQVHNVRHLDPVQDPDQDHLQENQDQITFICLEIHSILNMLSTILIQTTIMLIKLPVMVMLLPANIVWHCLMVVCKLYATQPIGKQAIMQMSVMKVNLNFLRDLVADQATNTKPYHSFLHTHAPHFLSNSLSPCQFNCPYNFCSINLILSYSLVLFFLSGKKGIMFKNN